MPRPSAIKWTAYGRKDEYKVDDLGIKYLYLAGFDLNGMIQKKF